MKYLFEKVGANLKATGYFGRTPAHRAAIEGDTEKLKDCKRADLEAKDNNGITPVHLAAMMNRHTKALKYLAEEVEVNLNVQDIKGMTPTHYVAGNNAGGLKVLIENKAKLNVEDINGKTPLDIAYEHFRLEERLEKKKELKEIINSLIKARAKTGEELRGEKKQKFPPQKVGSVCKKGGNRNNSRKEA